MKAKKATCFMCTVGVAALCVFGLAACFGSKGLTGGTAATVNGVAIPEDKVTTYIEGFRESSNLTKESDWKSWLSTTGYTPASLRETVINIFVQQEAIRLAAAERGLSVDAETIEGYVEDIRSKYNSVEDWQKALEEVGMTEDDYRDNIERTLLAEKLSDELASEAPASDEEKLLEYCTMYLGKFDGAKRSSHILFESGDTQTAQSVLDQLKDGSLEFEAAAAEYSIDGSASNGGDVGWDKLSHFITEYSDALDKLEVGQISGLVNSVYGIHIIKCTDKFEKPESLDSVDELPSEMVDYVRSMLTSQTESNQLSTYIEAYTGTLDVKTNEIPRSVPYYVSL